MAGTKKRRKDKSNPPWGYLSALLTGSVATLIGVAAGIDPYVILQRTLVAALVVGAATGGFCYLSRKLSFLDR